MESTLMTRKQISERFGVAMVTVIKWEKRGLIKPHERVNGRPRYLRTEVENLSQKTTDNGSN